MAFFTNVMVCSIGTLLIIYNIQVQLQSAYYALFIVQHYFYLAEVGFRVFLFFQIFHLIITHNIVNVFVLDEPNNTLDFHFVSSPA